MEINNLTNEQLEKIKCSVYPTIERWKRYKDTTYYVSTFGKIINTVDTHHNPTITKPLKPYYDKCGYRILNLHKPENHKLLVHRMVAETFIPNPNNKPCIDHISTNTDDNYIYNLRWVTTKENANNPITLINKHNRRKGIIKEKPIKHNSYTYKLSDI